MSPHLAPSIDHLLTQARDATAAGHARQAFDALYAAIALAPDSARARAAFGQFLLTHCPARRHADIDRVLCLALEHAWVRPSELAPAVLTYLAAEPAVANALGRALPSPRQLYAAAGHLDETAVFCALARVAVVADADWQTLLARIRELLLARRHEGKRDVPLRLSLAMALQNDLTDSIEPPSDDTLAKAQSLEAGLLARLQTGTSVNAADIALVASAIPLEDSPLARLLRGPGALRQWPALQLLVERLHATAREITLRNELLAKAARTASAHGADHRAADDTAHRIAHDIAHRTVHTAAHDIASDPVRELYDAHPYPRWVREPLGLPANLPPPVARRIADWPPTGAQVLVAGCGTGQQIFVAHDRYPLAHLTAIDFSVNALAHAMHKCAEAGLDNVTFHPLDLHRVAELGVRFHAIECVGVLPHLLDPEAGLAALVNVMAPGGVMYLAVYSARARAPFDALRRRIHSEGWKEDDAGRRGFRRKLIEESEAAKKTARNDTARNDTTRNDTSRNDTVPHPTLGRNTMPHDAAWFDVVFRSPDFHTTGGLRDLLFHVRECALPLADWVDMAANQGLKLMAVDTPPALATQARALTNQDPTTLTPDQWDEVEQACPSAFANLYRLWLTKA